MGTGASVPKETSSARKPPAVSAPPPSTVPSLTTSSHSSAKDDFKATSSVGGSMSMGIENFLVDDAGEKPISNNKLKKMALGIQGYKDKDRDYDQTLAQMDFNKTQNVEWSEPKSPEKVLTKKASKDNVALEMKHDASSPSLRPYGNSRTMEFSPMSTLQPKSSAQNVLSPGMGNPPRPHGTPAPGPPPGVAVRPFPGGFSGKAPEGSSTDLTQSSPLKGPIPSQSSMYQSSMVMTTPIKGGAPGTLASPPSQHYIVTPMAGPGSIPVRPFNAGSPAVNANMMATSVKGPSTPMMMAIPPNAVRGSAPVQVPIGGSAPGGPPMMLNTPNGPPQIILGPNGIPVGAIAVPMSAIPVGAIPMNAVPMGMPPGGSASLVPASPAGVIAAAGPGLGPRGPPSSTTPLPIVKETKDVKRNKAQLPSNLTHAKPTTGDWLNKRYIVNNYILLDVLGTGSYGEVRLCKDRTSERLYAIKIISKDFLKKRKNGKTTETYFEDIKREIAIMKKLLHPNILRLYEVLDDPKVNKMYLVLEYMKKGDLINVLKKRDGNGNDSDFQTLSDFEVWQIFRQLVTGIRYLHFQNIVHGDIKPQNLLLGEDGLVKIADFGISQMLSGSDEQLHDAGGTPAFMAPELCEGKKNFSGQLADIWAIGATIFMLRFGQPPFVAKSIINLYYKICNDPLVFPATPSIEPGLQNLIEGMLEKNPEKRLTIAQIVAHPWYRQPPPPPSLASLAPAVNVMASPMVGNKGRPSVPTPAPAPSTSGSSNNGATTTGSNTPSRPQSSNGGASATAPTSDAAVPTFQPPPSYDDEANEAMKGPIHRTILNNDDVFMSIGNISVTEHEDYEGAIGDVIEEGEDEDSDEEEDNDEDEGGHGKKAKGVKAADKLLGRNRDALIAANKDDGSRSEHKDGSSLNDARRPSRSSANPSPPPPAVAEDKRDKLGRKIKPAAAKAAAKDSDSSDSDDGVGDGDDLVSELASSKSPSKKKSPAATAAAAAAGGESPSLMETGGGDIMGTNWGADVFQMVEDDEDDRGDDDDDEVDVDSDEGNDRFDATRVQANGDTKGKTMVRKESHSEMSEEEEARRSRRFMKKITKKSTENMMRSLPSDGTSGSTGTGAAAASSSAAAGSRSAATAAASSSKAKTASASSSGTQNHSSMAKSQSQPLTLSTPHIGLSSHSTTGSAAQLFPAGPPSQSTGLNSLNTSSTSSSPLLKPGSRSARGDPTRTFSMNSTFDDDEPEALTTEEFQAMMDTLSQQNTQGSRYAGNGVEPIGEEGEGEESSSRAPGGANGGGGSGGSGGSGPSSAQSTLAAGGHRSNSVTDQGLIDVAMQVVWDQIESLKVSYLNPRVKIGGAFHSEQGIRPTQEDRCVLLPNVAAMQALTACDLNPGTKEQLNMFALAGIFDGHDGWRASQYLAQYLATMLVTHDKFVDPKQLNHAINDTFTSIDLQLCDLLREEEDNSGSTGVVAVYDGRKKTLTVAGVGDSLCILCRNGHAVEMNKMHRITDNLSERERVKNAGGTIINNRVNGVLAVSRSFGDTPFKTLHEIQSNVAAPSASHPPSTGANNHGIASAPSTYLRPPVKTSNLKAKIPLHRLVNESLVTAVPEIYTEIITPKTEFALLASDGLWDTMTPQLAVSFVRERLARDHDLQHAAQAVVQEALRRGSIDNVTVLILSFNVNIHA